MTRYIDTEIIAKIVFDYWKEGERIERIIPAIKRAIIYNSTTDVVERKKGRWNTDKESPEYATCSVCGHCDWDCTESEYFKYCPNCGARMEVDND